MTQQHPITPPPGLVQKWAEQFEAGKSLYAMFEDIYRAGADQELDACCEWMTRMGYWGDVLVVRDGKDGKAIPALYAARRPKPPSLKEQALRDLTTAYNADKIDDTTFENILRALEQLND